MKTMEQSRTAVICFTASDHSEWSGKATLSLTQNPWPGGPAGAMQTSGRRALPINALGRHCAWIPKGWRGVRLCRALWPAAGSSDFYIELERHWNILEILDMYYAFIWMLKNSLHHLWNFCTQYNFENVFWSQIFWHRNICVCGRSKKSLVPRKLQLVLKSLIWVCLLKPLSILHV